MRTETDLRAAYAHLADHHPRVDDLHIRTSDRTSHAPARRRGLVASAIALAAVVAAVIVAIVVVTDRNGGGGTQPASGPQIVCAPGAGQTPSASQLDSDRQTILDRLTRLGIRDGTVHVNATDELVITAPGITAAQAAGLCAEHRLELRPLVAPAVQVSGSTSTSDDPLAGLPFEAPTSDADYDRLPPAQQNLLTTALKHAACTSLHTPPPTSDRVVCDTQGSPPIALLLGPTIVDGTQVETATAIPPDASVSGAAQWAVAITLEAGGQAKWSSYTAAHNTGGNGDPASSVMTCRRTQTPCADFVAFVLDGSVVSVPFNLDAITGSTTQITGALTQDAATALAAQIATGRLAVPLRTVSVPGPGTNTIPAGTPS